VTQRNSGNSAGASAPKTPTFVEGAQLSPGKGRKPRHRRRRASTPHPTSNSSGASESATTSPDTTPEKQSRGRRRRKTPKKSKMKESRDGPAVSSRQPATLTDLKYHISKENSSADHPKDNEIKDITPSPEPVSKMSQLSTPNEAAALGKPSSAVEALTMEIYYPSLQTTAILEFEPVPATQSAVPTEELPPSSTTKPQVEKAEKPKKRSRKSIRLFRRPRRVHRPKPPQPNKPVAEEGARPALAMLFERYGAEFTSDKRPYLQFTTLEQAELVKSPNVDVQGLRAEFLKAFNTDNEREWPGREILMSPIDQYFATNDDGTIETFQYDPRREATVEFLRLSLETGWIDKCPAWDITNWDASLKKFEKIWSRPRAKIERIMFKEACFLEFDQVNPTPKFIIDG
jgi:hypothetical protein